MGTALSFVTANDHKILNKAEEELTKEITGTCFDKFLDLRDLLFIQIQWI